MNLIKMNFYRFFRMKLIYILLILAALFVCFTVLDGRTTSESDKAMFQEFIDETEQDGDKNFGVTVDIWEDYTYDRVTSSVIGSQILLVFMAIFVCCYMNEERARGFIKNLNSCTNSKAQLYLSRIPIIAAFSAMLIASVFAGAVISGVSPPNCSVSDLILFYSLQWLLHTGFGMFVCMIMELCRNQIIGIVVGFAASISIPTVIISTIMSKLPALSNYGNISFMLLSPFVKQISIVEGTEALSMWPYAVASALILGSLYSIAGLMSIKKRDLC